MTTLQHTVRSPEPLGGIESAAFVDVRFETDLCPSCGHSKRVQDDACPKCWRALLSASLVEALHRGKTISKIVQKDPVEERNYVSLYPSGPDDTPTIAKDGFGSGVTTAEKLALDIITRPEIWRIEWTR